MATKINKKPTILKQPQSGFTLIETMFVLVLVGILSAIAVPSYLGLLNRQRLNNAQEQVLTAMQTAQASAKREKNAWVACFYDDGAKVSWSVNRLPESSSDWNCAKSTNWQEIIGESSRLIAISSDKSYTTLAAKPNMYYPVQFKYDGSVTPLGKITLEIRNETNGLKRCVVISTLLGALRTARDNDCAKVVR